jgi:replicative DNA helicase
MDTDADSTTGGVVSCASQEEAHAIRVHPCASVVEPNMSTMKTIITKALGILRRASGARHSARLRTGLRFIDKTLGGLPPGITVIAGRPGSGKSSMEGLISGSLLQRGVPVARVCLDMPKSAVLERGIATLIDTSLPKLCHASFDEKTYPAIRSAREWMETWPMHLLDGVSNIKAICAWAEMKKETHGIKLLTIDYIQHCTNELGKSLDPYTNLKAVCEELSELSDDLGIPILVLSQLHRNGSINEALAQHSNAMVILENEKAGLPRRRVSFRIVKNRIGACADIPLWFYPSTFRFKRNLLLSLFRRVKGGRA